MFDTSVLPTLQTCSKPSDIILLIDNALQHDERLLHFGSCSASIYDTAWVAMVHQDEPNAWLFPEAFEYILVNQLEEGTWTSYSSQADGIFGSNSQSGCIPILLAC